MSAAPPLEEGTEIPVFEVELTRQRLIMEAAANRDFAPIHYDVDAARASGAPGPYANTTFIETLFEATLRTWAGLGARIAMIEFSMRDFNCAGDLLRAGGRITGTREAGGEVLADLELWVDGPRVRTVTGSATVAFARA